VVFGSAGPACWDGAAGVSGALESGLLESVSVVVSDVVVTDSGSLLVCS
jgi:hypothetical protein